MRNSSAYQNAARFIAKAWSVGVADYYAASLCVVLIKLNGEAALSSATCRCDEKEANQHLTKKTRGTETGLIDIPGETRKLLAELTSIDEIVYAAAVTRLVHDIKARPEWSFSECLLPGMKQ